MVAPSRVRRSAPMRLVLAATIACLGWWPLGVARSQPFSVWLHADVGSASVRSGATLALHDLRLDDLRADAWLRLGAAHGAGAAAPVVGIGASVRYSDTFGPLGSVVIEGGGSAAGGTGDAPAVVGRAWLGARGTVANVAVSVALEGGSAAPSVVDPVRPEPADEAGRQALRTLDDQRRGLAATAGVPDLGARLGVTFRPERTLIAHADASLRRIGADVAARSRVTLRRSGLGAELEAWTAIEAEVLGATLSGAYGLGLLQAPRRGNASWLYGWLGVGPNGVWPGVEGRWSSDSTLGPVTIDLRWRPWLAASSWDATLALRRPLRDAELTWQLGASGVGDGIDLRLSLRWRGALP